MFVIITEKYRLNIIKSYLASYLLLGAIRLLNYNSTELTYWTNSEKQALISIINYCRMKLIVSSLKMSVCIGLINSHTLIIIHIPYTRMCSYIYNIIYIYINDLGAQSSVYAIFNIRIYNTEMVL